MAQTPTDVSQQAIDAIGSEVVLGDISEGTREAAVILRAYRQCLMQLLRAVHWNFARRQAPMTLLGDATGQTPGVGVLVAVPWRFCYMLPIDCMKVRFVPWNPSTVTGGVPTGNIQPPNSSAPIVAGLGSQPQIGSQLRPARFLEAVDTNYPPPGGSQSWEVQGVSPQGRTVILTNVQNASLVYTGLMNYPSNWDAQFRAAFVAYLASEIALPLYKDKKLGMAIANRQIGIAKQKIMAARVTDGNEGVHQSSFSTDWIQFRRTGGRGLGDSNMGGGDGPGYMWGSWDACGFSDGSAY